MDIDRMPKQHPCTNTGPSRELKLPRNLGLEKTGYLPELHDCVSTTPNYRRRPRSDKPRLCVHEYEDNTHATSKSARCYRRQMDSPFGASQKLPQIPRTHPKVLKFITEEHFKMNQNIGLANVNSTRHMLMSKLRHDHRNAVRKPETANSTDTVSIWSTKQSSPTTQSDEDSLFPSCETVVDTKTTGDNADVLNCDANESSKTVRVPLESRVGLYAPEYHQLQGKLGGERGKADSNRSDWTVYTNKTKRNYAYVLNDVMNKHSPTSQNTDMFMQQGIKKIETTHNPETTRDDKALQDDSAMRDPDSRLSRQNEQSQTYGTLRNTNEKETGGPKSARRTRHAVILQQSESVQIKFKASRHTETQRPIGRKTPKHSETGFVETESNIQTQQHTGAFRCIDFPQNTYTQFHAESHQRKLGARWHDDTTRAIAVKWNRSPAQADRRRLVPSTSSSTPARKRARLYSNTSKTEAENIWIGDIRASFSNLHNRPHFMPVCVFNRTSSETVELAGEKLAVPVPSTQLSDVRENEAQNRVMQTFQQTFQHSQNQMAIVFNVIFDNYLNNTNYSTCVEDKTMLPQHEIHGRGLKEEVSASAGRHSQTQTASQTKGSDTRVQQGNETPQRQKDKSLKVQMQESKSVQGTKSSAEASRRGEVNALFWRPRDLSPELQRGKFDMIFINKKHGLIICDIKTVGDTFHVQGQAMTEEKEHEIIRDKVTKALKQLDKEEKVLKYLTSDKVDGLKIRTVLILPNIKRNVMLKVLGEDRQLEQDFCCRFGSDNTEAALSRCLFAEDFPPIGLAWETDDDVIKRLQKTWWKGLTDGDDGNAMDDDVYESIVARFCGPATNLHACTVFQPRADVTTLHDAVLETAACFQLPTLTREQLEILKKTRDAKVYVTGPPGTGKSLMLKLKVMQWAKQGYDVFIVSLWHSSETGSRVLFEQIQESLLMPRERDKVQLVAGKNSNFAAILTEIKNHLQNLADLHRGSTIFIHEIFSQSQIDLDVEMHEWSKTEVAEGNGEDPEAEEKEEKRPKCDRETMHNEQERCGEQYNCDKAVKKRQAPNVKVTGRTDISSPIYLILDEVPWILEEFVKYLERTYRGKVHLWAASSYSGSRPESFKEVKLTQSLRCPPVVTREIQKGSAYSTRAMYHYATGDSAVLSSVPPPTDGPPVKRIRHVHLDKDVWDCEECGVAVGQFLTEDLLIGKPDIMSKNTSQRRLRFRDVLVSGYVTFTASQNPPRKSAAEKMDVEIDNDQASSESYFLRGLKKSGVPYDIFRKEDSEKLACPTEDKVQVAEADSVQGLERPVVVLIGTNDMGATYPRYVDPWCDVIGTCVAQLVVVTPTHSFNRQLNLE